MDLKTGSGSHSLTLAALIVFFATLLSRLLGFVREMVIAHYFGASAQTDAFLIAFIVPGIVANLVSLAVVSALIPVFTEYYIKHGEAEAWKMTSTIINLLFFLLILGTFFTALAAPFIVSFLGPGLSEATRELAESLIRFMSPAVLFMGLGGLTTALLNAYKNFFPPAFAGLFLNIGIITFPVLFAKSYGALSLALGVVVGSFLQLLGQIPSLAKKFSYYKLSIDLKHSGVRQFFLLMLPFFVGTALWQINLVVDRVLASSLEEGSIAALNFGARVMDLPIGLFGISLVTALYPTLSQQVVEERLDQLRRTLSEALRILWFLLIPSSIGLIVLSEPIMRLLFERGAFDARATHMTSIALTYYSIGIFAHGANFILTRVFFSMKDFNTPVKLGAISVAINIILNLILIRYLAHGGLALATSIAAIVNFLLLTYALRKKLGSIDESRILQSGIKILFASLIMGLVCFLGLKGFQSLMGENIGLRYQALQVGGLIFLGFFTYILLAFLLRMEELKRFIWLIHKVKEKILGSRHNL